MLKPQDPYRVLTHLQHRWAAQERPLAFRAETEGDWRVWRRKLRRKLRALTGYDTMQSAPLQARITEERDFGDYVRQRVEIHTEPDVVMPFYALIPKAGKPPYPAVLAPHGHGGGGKAAVVGDRSHPEVAKAIDHYNYAYGLEFVRAGMLTLCPDARGFGERREQWAEERVTASSCLTINNMATPLGQTVTGMWAWELHRLVDYVQQRDDVQSNRIGCAGLSGGGLQTLWASALDDRIRCAVISGYLYGYKESLLDLCANCSCNYVPRLYEHVDMGDIAALIAPRPLLVETGAQDNLNGASGLKNVRSQMHIIRRAYRLLGQPRAVVHDIFEGPHRWNGKKAVPWMVRRLTSD